MESIREQIEGLEKLLHELTHPAKNSWTADKLSDVEKDLISTLRILETSHS